MNTTKTLFAAILITLVSVLPSQAQMSSPIGLGFRATPDGGGFTGKFFLDRYLAIEAQMNASGGGFGDNDGPSFTVVGIFEYNIILPDPSWRIFVGPGLHFGAWDRYNDGYRYNDSRGSQGIFGFDAIGGVEYRFRHIPIGLSADIKPAVNIVSDAAFFPNNSFGVSARYYLGHHMAPRRPQPVRE